MTAITVIARLSLTPDQLDAVDFMAAAHRVGRDDFLTGLVLAQARTYRVSKPAVVSVLPFQAIGEVAERLTENLRTQIARRNAELTE